GDRRFFESTKGRIVHLLRTGDRTVDDLAGELGLTDNAVRNQLALLERDGMVEQRGVRRGRRKPSFYYGLSHGTEERLSGAYAAMLVELVRVLGERYDQRSRRELLEETGRRLAPFGPVSGDVSARVRAANDAFTALGAVSEITEQNGRLWIHGLSCPLSAAVRQDGSVCVAVQNLIARVVGGPVLEHCDPG